MLLLDPGPYYREFDFFLENEQESSKFLNHHPSLWNQSSQNIEKFTLTVVFVSGDIILLIYFFKLKGFSYTKFLKIDLFKIAFIIRISFYILTDTWTPMTTSLIAIYFKLFDKYIYYVNFKDLQQLRP